jgi:hypothetical protein
LSPSVPLKPNSGPPTTETMVSGSGFTANTAVDIYFATDMVLASTDGSRRFSKIEIQFPQRRCPANIG